MLVLPFLEYHNLVTFSGNHIFLSFEVSSSATFSEDDILPVLLRLPQFGDFLWRRHFAFSFKIILVWWLSMETTFSLAVWDYFNEKWKRHSFSLLRLYQCGDFLWRRHVAVHSKIISIFCEVKFTTDVSERIPPTSQLQVHKTGIRFLDKYGPASLEPYVSCMDTINLVSKISFLRILSNVRNWNIILDEY
jgi:hypothetical protein